ncbi:DUF1642 domain-containing protein [Streptococcus hyovaginalis]
MNKQEAIDAICNLKTNDGWVNRYAVVSIVDQIEPEKPVVPQVAVDYYEQYKDNLLSFSEWFDGFYEKQFLEGFQDGDKLQKWLYDNDYETNRQRELALATLIVNGVEGVRVEQEKLYTVKLKANDQVLSKHYGTIGFVHSSIALSQSYIQFSKADLEQAGFGWVFDCDGVKVVEE